MILFNVATPNRPAVNNNSPIITDLCIFEEYQKNIFDVRIILEEHIIYTKKDVIILILIH
jgi:hypothetical protein